MSKVLYIGGKNIDASASVDLLSSLDALQFSEHKNKTYDVVHLTMEDKSDITFDPMSIANTVVPVLSDHLGELKVTIPNEALIEVVKTAFLMAGISVQSEAIIGKTRILSGAYSKQKSKISAGRLKFNEEKKEDVERSRIVKIDLDDEDIIDEDDLLNAGVIDAPPSVDVSALKRDDDCGGRKPCDDCTCGRAEREAQGIKETNVAPTSSCGNCGKGDAFRCAGCPYLGKPAFKAGEEHLVLDLADDL
mmetsp:Transcript_19992/g.25907  ORF Transcript_19992/g.25907 Transcript_19992/m.25907 type:complete len:248 (+) Transcript_19992:99-842(+)